jgi:K(+)-stimulated pyrophosphate-energized sodium pump
VDELENLNMRVDISTKAALREMMLPGVLTIGFPTQLYCFGKLVYGDNNQLIARDVRGYMSYCFGVLLAVFKTMPEGV